MMIRLAEDAGKILIRGGSYESSVTAPIVVEEGSYIDFQQAALRAKKTYPLIDTSIVNFPPYSLEGRITGEILSNDEALDAISYLKSRNRDRTFGDILAYNLSDLKSPEQETSSNGVPTAIFRGQVQFLINATKGQEVSLHIAHHNIGSNRNPSPMLTLTSPSGKIMELFALGPNESKDYNFIPEETGIYRIDGTPRGNGLQITRSTVPVNVSLTDNIFNPISPKGSFFFRIPPNIEDASILVAGQGNEWVDVVLEVDGVHIEEPQRIYGMREFRISNKSTDARIGRLKIIDAAEDVFIFLPPPLHNILSADTNVFFP